MFNTFFLQNLRFLVFFVYDGKTILVLKSGMKILMLKILVLKSGMKILMLKILVLKNINVKKF